MQPVQIVVVIITVICNTLLGYIAYKNNPKSATHRFLAFITLIIALWSIANYFSLNTKTEEGTLFWIKAVMVITTPLAPALYLFLKAFPEDRLTISRSKIVFVSIVVLIVSLISATPLIFSNVSISEGVKPVPGPGIILYGLSTVGFLIAGFYVIWTKYRISEGITKLRLKYIVLGAVLTFSLQVITNYLLVIIFSFSNFVAFGPTFSLILVGTMTYAIVKHRLLDIKILAVQVFSALMLIVLFSKLLVFVSLEELLVDLVIFTSVLIFSILLIRSVGRDVKQREQLEILNQKLKDLDKQKDEFISLAAHELRAPLAAIKGYISMIMEGDAGDITEKARGFLADTNAVNERLIRLVNNMLNVSKIEEGKLVYEWEIDHLSEIVRTVYAEFAREAQRKGLKFSLDIPREIKDRVYVDPDKIHEVVGNLVSNAIKYTDIGAVEIKLSQPKEKVLHIDVVDTGPGISKDEQQKLFRKFSRAESSVGKTVGTGLGLYISKLLIEKFNGKIGLESDVGKGSTFWFELPLASKQSQKQPT